MKLANDKYSAEYTSPESGALPASAVWRNAAYGTNFEPAVFAYNKRFVEPADVPRTHADFATLRITTRAKYAGKVADTTQRTFD